MWTIRIKNTWNEDAQAVKMKTETRLEASEIMKVLMDVAEYSADSVTISIEKDRETKDEGDWVK